MFESYSDFESRVVRPLIAALSGYEMTAILTGWVPTLTSLVKWLYGRWWGQAICWAFWGWATAHFFVREIQRMESESSASQLRR